MKIVDFDFEFSASSRVQFKNHFEISVYPAILLMSRISCEPGVKLCLKNHTIYADFPLSFRTQTASFKSIKQHFGMHEFVKFSFKFVYWSLKFTNLRYLTFQRANRKIINAIWRFWPKNLRQKLQNVLTIFSFALRIGTKRVDYGFLSKVSNLAKFRNYS
jgi:hypothetical protein